MISLSLNTQAGVALSYLDCAQSFVSPFAKQSCLFDLCPEGPMLQVLPEIGGAEKEERCETSMALRGNTTHCVSRSSMTV